MRLKSLLLASAAVSLLSAPVRAEHHYVSLFGGLNVPETTRTHYRGSTAYDISRDTGYVIGGALGTALWSDRWRGELELAYATSDISNVFDQYNDATREAFGDLAHLTLLANLWRDFALSATDLHPYIGGGLGVGLNLSDWCFDRSGDSVCEDWHSHSTSEPALAAQGGFGVRFPMSDRLMLDLGYRLRTMIGADMAGNFVNPGGSPPGQRSMMGADFITHSFQAGLSFAPSGIVENSGEDEDWYLSLFGGLNIPETTRTHYRGSTAYDISRDTGYVIGGALGTTLWSDSWRGELELAYTRSDVSEVFERYNSTTHEAFGDLAHLTFLANLWRDFALPTIPIHPYVGGGLGVALNLPDWCFDGDGDDACEDEHSYSSSELALAAQAGLGVRFAMNDRLMLDLGYRLRAVIGADMAGHEGGLGTSAPGFGSTMGADFVTHSLQAGLSFLPGGIAESSGEDEHWYVSLFGGLSVPDTTRVHYWGTTAYDISRDTGFVIGGALGTNLWGDEWRGEVELAYARSDVSEILTRRNGTTTPALGDLAHLALMANLWRNFALPAANIHPYLGGGLGVALTLPDWCINWTDDDECVDNDDSVFDTSEPALAAQAGLGVRFPMSNRLMLDLGYRLRGVFGADMAGNYINSGGTAPGCCSMMGADFITHNLQAGLTWSFF